jgi:hypothetical protein
MHRCDPKSFLFKILPVNPYYSKILVLTSLQLHCFHRPEGEGVPPAARSRVGNIRVNADCRHRMNREIRPMTEGMSQPLVISVTVGG